MLLECAGLLRVLHSPSGKLLRRRQTTFPTAHASKSSWICSAMRAWRKPADVFKVFGPRMWRIRPMEFFVSVSTRGLPAGSYKITRYYDVREFRRRAESGEGGMPGRSIRTRGRRFINCRLTRPGSLPTASRTAHRRFSRISTSPMIRCSVRCFWFERDRQSVV